MKKYFNKINDLPAFFYTIKFEDSKNQQKLNLSEISIDIKKRNSKKVRIGNFFKPIHPINLNNE